MNRENYPICDGEKCEDCLTGKFKSCGECSFCTNRLMDNRVFPFDDPNQIDEEAAHLILGDDPA